MIHRLQIKGFKCFDNADFSFGNLTLLAGKNSMGKSTVIQAILAMIQDGNNPFAGPYINIGKISELKNKYVGSKEIESIINSAFSKKIFDDKSKIESQGKLSEEVTVTYLSADRIGVRDTYETNSDNPDKIGVRCEYAYQYLAKHARDDWKENVLVYDPEIHLHPSGQSELILFLAFLAENGIQIIMETHSDHIYNGVRKCICMDCIENTKVAVYFFDEAENGGSIPVKIPLDNEGKVLLQKDGLFDQMKKDLDIILGW